MKTILTIVLVGLLGAAGCAMFGGPRQSTPGAGTTASNEESPGSTAIAPGPVQQQGWVNVTYTSAKAAAPWGAWLLYPWAYKPIIRRFAGRGSAHKRPGPTQT